MGTYQPRVAPASAPTSVQSKPYGLHNPYNKGYDATSQAKFGTPERAGSSGHFRVDLIGQPQAQIDLWITEVSADFSLSGVTGQSQLTREFFPRSFNDVVLTITGNVSSTYEFNRLALFVREHHWEAMNLVSQGKGPSSSNQLITFHLDNGDANWQHSWRSIAKKPSATKAAGPQSNVKGIHRPWDVQGYVKTVKAGAVHHEVAPEFSIEFVVVQTTLSANTGIWEDLLAKPQSLNNILTMVNIEQKNARVTGQGFVANPLAKPPSAIGNVISSVWSVSGAVSKFAGF